MCTYGPFCYCLSVFFCMFSWKAVLVWETVMVELVHGGADLEVWRYLSVWNQSFYRNKVYFHIKWQHNLLISNLYWTVCGCGCMCVPLCACVCVCPTFIEEVLSVVSTFYFHFSDIFLFYLLQLPTPPYCIWVKSIITGICMLTNRYI